MRALASAPEVVSALAWERRLRWRDAPLIISRWNLDVSMWTLDPNGAEL